MRPQLATNTKKLFEEIERLRLSDEIDEFTFARLEREIDNLLKIDQLNAYLLRGALAGLKHDLTGVRENHQFALKLATINEDKATVLQNHATTLEWNGYFSEAAKLAIESYDIFPSTYHTQRVIELFIRTGLFHQAVNFMRQYPQKLQNDNYRFFFQVEQLMDQQGVSDELLQQLIEMAIAVLHKHEFFNFHNNRIREELVEDESELCFCYTIKVKRSMVEVIDLNYELAREIAKSGLPTSLTLNFVPMYEVA